MKFFILLCLLFVVSCGSDDPVNLKNENAEPVIVDHKKECEKKLLHRWEDEKCQTFEQLGAPSIVSNIDDQIKHDVLKKYLKMKRSLNRDGFVLNVDAISIIEDSEKLSINNKILYLTKNYDKQKLKLLLIKTGIFDQYSILYFVRNQSSYEKLLAIKKLFSKSIRKLSFQFVNLVKVRVSGLDLPTPIRVISSQKGYLIDVDNRVNYKDVLAEMTKIKQELKNKNY